MKQQASNDIPVGEATRKQKARAKKLVELKHILQEMGMFTGICGSGVEFNISKAVCFQIHSQSLCKSQQTQKIVSLLQTYTLF